MTSCFCPVTRIYLGLNRRLNCFRCMSHDIALLFNHLLLLPLRPAAWTSKGNHGGWVRGGRTDKLSCVSVSVWCGVWHFADPRSFFAPLSDDIWMHAYHGWRTVVTYEKEEGECMVFFSNSVQIALLHWSGIFFWSGGKRFVIEFVDVKERQLLHWTTARWFYSVVPKKV